LFPVVNFLNFDEVIRRVPLLGHPVYTAR